MKILSRPKGKLRPNLNGCHATEEVEEAWNCMCILFLMKIIFKSLLVYDLS
jgi:hypothetical protein